MRYEIDKNNYITNVYFNCNSGSCTEYTGTIPDGYSSLEEWAANEIVQAWKIDNRNLVYDANRAAELERQCELENMQNSPATQGYVIDKLNQANSVVVDELSNTAEGTSLIHLKDSGDYNINSLKLPLSNEMYLKYRGATGQETKDGYNFIPTDASEWEQGSIVGYNGTNHNDASALKNRIRMKNKYPISLLEHIIYFNNLTDDYVLGSIHYYDSNGTWINSENNRTGLSTYTEHIFTPPANTAYFRAMIRKVDNAELTTDIIETIQPMLVEGTEKKEFDTYGDLPSQYKRSPIKSITGDCTLVNEKKSGKQTFSLSLGNIELCKANDFQDYIYKKTNKWYKYKAIEKAVFNGTEIWQMSTKDDGTKAFWNLYHALNLANGIRGQKYCDGFKYENISWRDTTSPCMCENANDNNIIIFCLNNYSINTIDEWNAFLQEDNLTAYYILETPIDEEITDTTLIEQLDIITKELKLDDETVHFYLESENGLRADIPMYLEEELQLKVTNDNLIKNTAVSQTIGGVEVTVNEDKTIILNGTAEEDIELILNGSDTNTDMLFLLKSGIGYYQNGLVNGTNISLYNYDGTDRTAISNISNGQINLSNDEVVTEVVLNITNGTAFSNAKIYPNLTISNEPKQYRENQESDLVDIDLSSFIFNTGDYVEIKDDSVYLISGKDEEYVQCLETPLKTFYPETYAMLNKYSNMSIDYFRDKYLTNTINEIRSDIDGISIVVEENLQSTDTITNKNILHLPNAYSPSNLIELRIRGSIELFYLGENSYLGENTFLLNTYLIQDTAETLTENAKKHHLPINYLLYINENVCDEFVLTKEDCYIIRRVGENADGSLYELENEETVSCDHFEIPMFENDNYFYLEHFKEQGLVLTATYEIKNQFNENYAKKAELKLTEESIRAEVLKKVGDDEIIARINMAILGKDDAEIPEDVNKSIIEILANKLSIKSDNFELTKDGIITAKAGNIAGLTMTRNASGNSYLAKNYVTDDDETYQSGLFIPNKTNGNSIFLYAGAPIDGYLSDANLYIRHDGIIKAKYFMGNGESGSFHINFDSGRRALWLGSGCIYFYIDDEANNFFGGLGKSNRGFTWNLNSAYYFNIYDFLHNQEIASFHRHDDSGNDGYIHLNKRTMYFAGSNTGYEIATKNDISDKKAKKNIKNTKLKALDRINKFDFIEFDWDEEKVDRNGHIDIGVLANQLKEIDENYVEVTKICKKKEENNTKVGEPQEVEEEEFYSINILNLLITTTKATQELAAENRGLKEQITKQQKMIDFLTEKLGCKEELENYLKGENKEC